MYSKTLDTKMNATPATKQAPMKIELSRALRTVSGCDPKIIYLDRVCRTCLVEREKDQLKDLFEFCLADTIMSCTRITVNFFASHVVPERKK